MNEINGVPTGREYGAMRREVDFLLKHDQELHLKIDEMPANIVAEVVKKINDVRELCPHPKSTIDHEKRLRRIEKVLYGCAGAWALVNGYPHIVEMIVP